MPNWCTNWICIENDDVNKLKELEIKINEWADKEFMPNSFRGGWLGNIVGNSGIATKEDIEDMKIHCRGSLNWTELDGNILQICTETAWVPMIKMWQMIVDQYIPGSKITYESEECGNELYQTNKIELYGKYILDVYDEKLQRIHEGSNHVGAEELVKFLQKVLDTGTEKITTLLRIYDNSESLQKRFSIHRWEYYDIADQD